MKRKSEPHAAQHARRPLTLVLLVGVELELRAVAAYDLAESALRLGQAVTPAQAVAHLEAMQ